MTVLDMELQTIGMPNFSDDYGFDPSRVSPTSSDEQNKSAALVKRPWTAEEDAALTIAVHKYGACRWSMIATHLSTGRVGKQCRERWNNHLCPDVKKTEWSEEEDHSILQGVAVLGTRWCEIVKASALVGRTDNAIKNRFYSLQRRMKARQGGATRCASPPTLGKRGSSESASTELLAPAQRDRIMSIATELAFSTDEQDRDRLISELTVTLHENQESDDDDISDIATIDSPASLLRLKCLSDLHFDDAIEEPPAKPLDQSIDISADPTGQHQPSSPECEDSMDMIGTTRVDSPNGGMTASSGSPRRFATSESAEVSEVQGDDVMSLRVCLGGRHAYKATLTPLKIPELANIQTDLQFCSSPKRLCTPTGPAPPPAASAEPMQKYPVPNGILGDDINGCGSPTGALRSSVGSKAGTEAPGPMSSPLSLKSADQTLESLQLSFFTDLFSPIGETLPSPGTTGTGNAAARITPPKQLKKKPYAKVTVNVTSAPWKQPPVSPLAPSAVRRSTRGCAVVC